jgi:hypothetical protein
MSRSVDWWLVTDVSGKPIGPTLKMRPIGFPKRRVVNYQYKVCNIPEERRHESQLVLLFAKEAGLVSGLFGVYAEWEKVQSRLCWSVIYTVTALTL